MTDEIMVNEHLEKPELPLVWDYDISVDKSKVSINKWKNVTVEFLCELWIAREKLSVPHRPKLSDANAPSWNSYCDDIGVDKSTANRWLQRAFEITHVTHNSGNNEWYTPSEYIEAARQVLGEIDLDPASSEIANKTVKAKIYFTAEDDGLKYSWDGRIWMNPPYSGDLIGKFTEKLARHYSQGEVTEAVVLINNATETNWFQSLLIHVSAVCFVKGRIKYWNADGVPENTGLQGQVILYLGVDIIRFENIFKDFGIVLFGKKENVHV